MCNKMTKPSFPLKASALLFSATALHLTSTITKVTDTSPCLLAIEKPLCWVEWFWQSIILIICWFQLLFPFAGPLFWNTLTGSLKDYIDTFKQYLSTFWCWNARALSASDIDMIVRYINWINISTDIFFNVFISSSDQIVQEATLLFFDLPLHVTVHRLCCLF